ncbi:DNA polymerase III subunit epsilon [Methylocystis parvus]|uniref:DNA polymerase III subunit epsilon n=1 Tax=Methylocystis parvus TaxID=134 RepID=A0A6B8M3V8_9HYPH|nr:DNA polymerase III subunit epsilon [Methylocystis parvus]QGM97076.1 DNA polymerase III subunit epsilon [Methylocystis parvus]WBJ99022.1 DNA polymerase III subunit epsilon [Methylocystis parvus OBBP]
MREIVFDTETTGLDPSKGDRVVEIGAVEILNLIPTGRVFHVYIDPERDMPEEAFRVHGLSREFLSQHKKFREIAREFVDFIEDSPLVAHNAEFDARFINAEFAMLSFAPLAPARIIDTLAMARRLHPGSPASLDALCQRYGVDLSRRDKHGALLDAGLLAEVYAELRGGRQAALSLAPISVARRAATGDLMRARPEPLPSRLTKEEADAHRAFVAALGKTVLWDKYPPEYLPEKQESGEQPPSAA